MAHSAVHSLPGAFHLAPFLDADSSTSLAVALGGSVAATLVGCQRLPLDFAGSVFGSPGAAVLSIGARCLGPAAGLLRLTRPTLLATLRDALVSMIAVARVARAPGALGALLAARDAVDGRAALGAALAARAPPAPLTLLLSTPVGLLVDVPTLFRACLRCAEGAEGALGALLAALGALLRPLLLATGALEAHLAGVRWALAGFSGTPPAPAPGGGCAPRALLPLPEAGAAALPRALVPSTAPPPPPSTRHPEPLLPLLLALGGTLRVDAGFLGDVRAGGGGGGAPPPAPLTPAVLLLALDALLAMHCAHLHAHLEDLAVPVAAIAGGWLPSLLLPAALWEGAPPGGGGEAGEGAHLPWADATGPRWVLSQLVADGWAGWLRAAMGVLAAFEGDLLHCASCEAVLEYVAFAPRRGALKGATAAAALARLGLTPAGADGAILAASPLIRFETWSGDGPLPHTTAAFARSTALSNRVRVEPGATDIASLGALARAVNVVAGARAEAAGARAQPTSPPIVAPLPRGALAALLAGCLPPAPEVGDAPAAAAAVGAGAPSQRGASAAAGDGGAPPAARPPGPWEAAHPVHVPPLPPPPPPRLVLAPAMSAAEYVKGRAASASAPLSSGGAAEDPLNYLCAPLGGRGRAPPPTPAFLLAPAAPRAPPPPFNFALPIPQVGPSAARYLAAAVPPPPAAAVPYCGTLERLAAECGGARARTLRAAAARTPASLPVKGAVVSGRRPPPARAPLPPAEATPPPPLPDAVTEEMRAHAARVAALRSGLREANRNGGRADVLPAGLAASWAESGAGGGLLLRLAEASAPLLPPLALPASPPALRAPPSDGAVWSAFARETKGWGEPWSAAAGGVGAAAAAAALLRATGLGSPLGMVDRMTERLRHGAGGAGSPWIGEDTPPRFAPLVRPPPPPPPPELLGSALEAAAASLQRLLAHPQGPPPSPGGASAASTSELFSAEKSEFFGADARAAETPSLAVGSSPSTGAAAEPRAPTPATLAAFNRAMAIAGLGAASHTAAREGDAGERLGAGRAAGEGATRAQQPQEPCPPDRAAASSSYAGANFSLKDLPAVGEPLGAALLPPGGGALFAAPLSAAPPPPRDLAQPNPAAQGEARRAAALLAAEASGRGEGSVRRNPSATVAALSEAMLSQGV
jgi:hypothetical protein